MIWKQVVMA